MECCKLPGTELLQLPDSTLTERTKLLETIYCLKEPSVKLKELEIEAFS